MKSPIHQLPSIAPDPTPAPLKMPGATLVTRLKVYDTPGPDGQPGGTPHVHLACTEMYFVLAGSGAVEVIDGRGFSRVELATHDAYLFSAGTIHRLINSPRGDMEILIVMQNSGLPERGDTVAPFAPEVVADDLRFHKAMRAEGLDGALRRRDAAVDGFLKLKAAFERSPDDGREALEIFYRDATKRAAARNAEWYSTVANGAFTEAQTTLGQILDLAAGKFGHLHLAQQALIPAVTADTVGFCGRLNRYFDPGTPALDGIPIRG